MTHQEAFIWAWSHFDFPAVIMGFANFGFLLVLMNWHVKDGPFDFRTALIDPAVNAISFARLGQLVALVSTTEWGMYLAIKNQLTEWYVMAYLSAWAGVAIYGKWQDSQNAKNNVELPKHPT